MRASRLNPVSHFAFLAVVLLLAPSTGHGHDGRGARAFPDAIVLPSNVRFKSLLDTAVRNGLTGVSLLVRGPGIAFAGAAGVANLSTGEALTPRHALYVASLGKTVTAVVALQLCEEGRLNLDAPITTWLPREVAEHIDSSASMTLRHLLSHTSGLVDYMNDDDAWRADFERDPHWRWRHADVVPYLYDRPLLFAPGSGFHYSNSNYILVGLIIERVTGKPFQVIVRERIIAPLGLEQTFNGLETGEREAAAHGYTIGRGRIIDTFPWYSHYGLADSGLFSTPGDLARFLASLFTTETILGGAMRAEMTRVPASGHARSDYGLGIHVQHNPLAPGPWYTHDGVDPGYQADMLYLPWMDLTIVLCANASLGKADVVYARLIDAVVRLALDQAHSRAAAPAPDIRPGASTCDGVLRLCTARGYDGHIEPWLED